MRSWCRSWVLHTGQQVVLLAGFALIMVGVGCLFLSGMVAASGSWRQGTLDPFGVGFIVGGLVDVVAVSLLNWMVNLAEPTSAELSRRLVGILGYADELRRNVDKSGAVMRSWCRSWVLHTGQQVVLLAGFALIMVGVGCLFLSGMVAASGSWRQGTLDPFGVGFIVGGLVDVVAVSLLNWMVNLAEPTSAELSRRLVGILGYADELRRNVDKSGAVMRSWCRSWVLHTGQQVVLLAGFALIMVGVGCLFLSGMVAASGSWWQGTLDPFGVGFIVGGLVDVVAVSLLNWMVNLAEPTSAELSRRSAGILGYADELRRNVDKSDAEMPDRVRSRVLNTAQSVVSLAGFALIMVGVGCLCQRSAESPHLRSLKFPT